MKVAMNKHEIDVLWRRVEGANMDSEEVVKKNDESDIEYIWEIAKLATERANRAEAEIAVLRDTLTEQTFKYRRIKFLYKRLLKSGES